MSTEPVLFRTEGSGAKKVGHATLSSEASLNSLTHRMLELLHPQLQAWAQDDSIAAVVIDGAGLKAFCAGGDVRQLHDTIVGNKPELADEFFEREYRLDYAIHTYPKPLIVWGHGIVMGGGIGLLSGASHRVVTETTKLAMPEITIGLYPDVAGSYFLNRTPEGVGLFLGLTGARINAADALFTKLGNVFIQNASKEAALKALTQIPWTADPTANKVLVNHCFAEFEQASYALLPKSELAPRAEGLRKLSEARDVQTYLAQLEAAAGEDVYLQTALKMLKAGCPVSARVTFAQIHRARGLSLEECFATELTMSMQCARHPDFAEGVRALLISKDNKPNWSFKSLDSVPDSLVETHFTWPLKAQPNPFLKNQPNSLRKM